jgi:hypothetical protein
MIDMNGYYKWLMKEVIFVLAGIAVVFVSAQAARSATGSVLDLVFLFIGGLVMSDSLFNLLLKEHEGIYVGRINDSAYEKYDWSDYNVFHYKHEVILIPPGTISRNSHIKIHWKRGVGAKFLSASEWFNY